VRDIALLLSLCCLAVGRHVKTTEKRRRYSDHGAAEIVPIARDVIPAVEPDEHVGIVAGLDPAEPTFPVGSDAGINHGLHSVAGTQWVAGGIEVSCLNHHVARPLVGVHPHSLPASL